MSVTLTTCSTSASSAAQPPYGSRVVSRSKYSVAVYIAFDDALDQYFMNYPDKLFGKP